MLGFKKQVYSSPSSPPRWLLPGTISSKPTNTGEFVVVTQKNQLLPNKSWKRLQRWFRPGVCVASKQKYSSKHRVRQQSCCDSSQQQCSRHWEWASLDTSCQSNLEFFRCLQLLELVSFSSVDKNSWLLLYALKQPALVILFLY